MKNTPQLPLKRKWNGPIDKSGKLHIAQMLNYVHFQRLLILLYLVKSEINQVIISLFPREMTTFLDMSNEIMHCESIGRKKQKSCAV